MIGSDFYKNMMINAGRKPVGTEPYNIPINMLDKCAYNHDAVFSRNNNTEKNIRDADIKFRECASKIKDANLKYYIQIQLAKTAIGLKEFGEDIGVIKPELFAYINKSVNDLNQTLAKNHTIPSTKEEQQQEDRKFYIVTIMGFFRIGLDFIIPILTRVGTEKLIKRLKDINIEDLMTRIPVSLRPMIEFVVNRLIGRRDVRQITKELANLGTSQIVTFLKGLITDSDFFGTGITGLLVKYGYTTIVQVIFDNFLTKLSTQFGSNSWRERNIMTAEEIDKIIEGRGADIYRAETQRNQEIGRLIGFDLNNHLIVGLTNLFRFMDNLSNREKISKFGIFYRDIIKIRNQRDRGILTIVYQLLTGSYRTQFVGDITVEKLREILNQRISNDDISILLNRPILIDKLKNLLGTNIIDRAFLGEYTYMRLIDKILRDLTITQKGLKDLLS
jgi:hypothetical protein